MLQQFNIDQVLKTNATLHSSLDQCMLLFIHIYLFSQFNYDVIQTCYIYKVVISVCLFVCLIKAQEPLDRFASNFDWGTRETHGNVLSLVLRF